MAELSDRSEPQRPFLLRGNDGVWSENGSRPEASPIATARALTAEAMELEDLDRTEEALTLFRRVIVEFGRSPEPELRQEVALSLLRTGLILGFVHRRSEARAALGALLKSFERGESPVIDEYLDLGHDRYQKLVYGSSR